MKRQNPALSRERSHVVTRSIVVILAAGGPANRLVRSCIVFCVSAIGAVIVMWLGFVGAWVFASHFPNFGRTLLGNTK